MVFNCFIAAISESLTIYCNVCRNIFQVFHRKLGIDCLLPHPRRPRNFRIWTIYYIQQVLWRRRIRLRTARPLDHCVLNRKRNQRDKTQPGFGSNRSRLNHESSFWKKILCNWCRTTNLNPSENSSQFGNTINSLYQKLFQRQIRQTGTALKFFCTCQMILR